jgi:hAT family C-terminal dimerisation region
MKGHVGGVQKILRDMMPRAVYVHCSNHSLDLVLKKSCELRIIIWFFGTLKNIIKFLSKSPKRKRIMKNSAAIVNDESRRRSLLKLVETRWVEKQSAVLVFRQLFAAITIALEHIINEDDEEGASLARGYLKSILDIEFCIPLIIVSRIFALTKPCSELLQTPSCDLIKCYECIEETATLISEMLYDGDQIDKVYDDLMAFVKEHDIPPDIPRRCKKTAKEYFTDTYHSFLENTLDELSSRFSEHQRIVVRISRLVPRQVSSTKFEELKEVIEFYVDDLPSNDLIVIEAEFDRWRSFWGSQPEPERPATIEQTLEMVYDKRLFYPNIWRLLELFAILPVSVASAERSFSVLKLIKTYLRNSMGDERLSSLALINIHRFIVNDEEDAIDIVDQFARQKRRIKFD